MTVTEMAERLHVATCGCEMRAEDGWQDMAEEVLAGRVTFEEACVLIQGDERTPARDVRETTGRSLMSSTRESADTTHQCPMHTEHAVRAGLGVVGRRFPNPMVDREGIWEFCEIEDAKGSWVGEIPRWLVALWLTGECFAGQEGCRQTHLCEQCFENAKVDFDLDYPRSRVVFTEIMGYQVPMRVCANCGAGPLTGTEDGCGECNGR